MATATVWGLARRGGGSRVGGRPIKVTAPQTGFLREDDLTKTLGFQKSALWGGNYFGARFVSGWRHLGPRSAHASVVKRCQKYISHFKKFFKKAPNPLAKLIFFKKVHFCSRILATFFKKYPEVLDWGWRPMAAARVWGLARRGEVRG